MFESQSNHQEVIELLEKWRKRARLKKKEVAQRAGLSEAQLYNSYWNPSRPISTDPGRALVIIGAFTQRLPASERCKPPEVRDFLRLTHFPPTRYSEVRLLFEDQEEAKELDRLLKELVPFLKPRGSAPRLPALIIGREGDLHHLKARLGATPHRLPAVQKLVVVNGWPGVGKTTVAAALAHDPAIATAFPDGILWTSLGQTPDLLAELSVWGRALDLPDFRSINEASTRLSAFFRDKRVFLVVDDVWEPEHATPFSVGGHGCAMLITTRVNSTAFALAPTPGAIYRLKVLSDEQALKLLSAVAPTIVEQHPEPCLELVHELEGLPLALQVAGRLLSVEANYGFSIMDLLVELREGARLLEAQAPADRVDLANETTPTVTALLQKSTNRLDPYVRDCFAYLGVFAPKPATFELPALGTVWQSKDPRPVVRHLVDRGLIEPVGEDRFQMHALLVKHARSLLTE